jgi:hypothetical protein
VLVMLVRPEHGLAGAFDAYSPTVGADAKDGRAGAEVGALDLPAEALPGALVACGSKISPTHDSIGSGAAGATQGITSAVFSAFVGLFQKS